MKNFLLIPQSIQHLFCLGDCQVHPGGQILRLREPAALLVDHLLQNLHIRACLFQLQGLDDILLASLVLVSSRI